jgi:hypothetical protein
VDIGISGSTDGAILCFDQYPEAAPDSGQVDAIALTDPAARVAWLVVADHADPNTDWMELIRLHDLEPVSASTAADVDFWSEAAELARVDGS